jgi:hypothetical protein
MKLNVGGIDRVFAYARRSRTGWLGGHGRPGVGLDRRRAPGHRRDRLVPAVRDLRLQHLRHEESRRAETLVAPSRRPPVGLRGAVTAGLSPRRHDRI